MVEPVGLAQPPARTPVAPPPGLRAPSGASPPPSRSGSKSKARSSPSPSLSPDPDEDEAAAAKDKPKADAPKATLTPNATRGKATVRSRSRSMGRPPGTFHPSAPVLRSQAEGRSGWAEGPWQGYQAAPSQGSTGWWYPNAWSYPQMRSGETGLPHYGPWAAPPVVLRPGPRAPEQPPSSAVQVARQPTAHGQGKARRPRRRRHLRSQKALDARAAKRAEHRNRQRRSESSSSSSS